MADCCSGGCSANKPPVDPAYRRVLWIALVVNAAMFGVELAGGWAAGSVSLLADAVDFFGDAANYGISLFVLGLAPLWRSRTALVKGATMGAYGVFVIASALWHLAAGVVPVAQTMGTIGFAALAANLLVAALLFAFRNGDANMRSVWLCTRNDAIGNVAVLLAAFGVWQSGSGLPDLFVAGVMGLLGLSAARSVILQARAEMNAAPPTVPAPTIELKRR
ncbi:cation transporter [Massilia sp. Dwa41.01b]|uniref:cation transporter n=1 Tax=unclassified Massilia TaxID=2609279 RepID=UPI00160068D7|nr:MULTISPECIES: cation transporter [unclassified Massilia]QNA88948.1 cation transporter [Massilia sp. Dwa41.01b]QNA99836.1 cation transporter [Massilia sp. Se16.2.3]